MFFTNGKRFFKQRFWIYLYFWIIYFFLSCILVGNRKTFYSFFGSRRTSSPKSYTLLTILSERSVPLKIIIAISFPMDPELLRSVSKSLLLPCFCFFDEKVVLFQFFCEILAKVDKIPLTIDRIKNGKWKKKGFCEWKSVSF